jgi:hypothetical protein
MHIFTIAEKESEMLPTSPASRDDSPYTTSFGNHLLWGGVDIREEFILPEQFFSPVQFHEKYRGEVALLYAILNDAILCFLGGRWEKQRERGRVVREAEAWLFANEREWPFSFINICELLDLNPTLLRFHLKRWQQSSTSLQTSLKLFQSPTLLAEENDHNVPHARLPRLRKRCQPVRQLHGKE